MNAPAREYDGRNKYLRITDIGEELRTFSPESLTSPECELDDSYKLAIGDLLFARTGASVGKSYLYKPEDGNVYYAGYLIKYSIINAVPAFVYQCTLTSKYKNWVRLMSARTGQPGINAMEYGSYKLHIPSKAEQERIAHFLEAVDDRIRILVVHKNSLTEYKKGVMQKLFSREIRFKDDDGNDYPDWEMIRLGYALDYEQPTQYIVTSTEYNDSYSIPVLTAGKTFILGYTDELFGVFKVGLPVIIFDDFTTASRYVDFPFKVKSSAMKILHAKPGYDLRFMAAVLENLDYRIGGHERHWISKFTNLSVAVPLLPEQQKIADFLSAIDKKIELVSEQIETTKLYKKGLLQQMFV